MRHGGEIKSGRHDQVKELPARRHDGARRDLAAAPSGHCNAGPAAHDEERIDAKGKEVRQQRDGGQQPENGD